MDVVQLAHQPRQPQAGLDHGRYSRPHMTQGHAFKSGSSVFSISAKLKLSSHRQRLREIQGNNNNLVAAQASRHALGKANYFACVVSPLPLHRGVFLHSRFRRIEEHRRHRLLCHDAEPTCYQNDMAYGGSGYGQYDQRF